MLDKNYRTRERERGRARERENILLSHHHLYIHMYVDIYTVCVHADRHWYTSDGKYSYLAWVIVTHIHTRMCSVRTYISVLMWYFRRIFKEIKNKL